MDNKRYKEIKKENDLIVSHLTGNYQRIAYIYIKKARGYAIKNIDTEMKIQDVIKLLEENDFTKMPFHLVITDENEFINNNIQKLSKQVKDPDRIKTIVGVSLIALFIIAWTAISIWMRQDAKAPKVQNVKYELITDTSIKITWDEHNLASNGYYIWMEDNKGNILEGKYSIREENYIFTIEKNKEYNFFIQVKKTDYFDVSDPVKLKYVPSN